MEEVLKNRIMFLMSPFTNYMGSNAGKCSVCDIRDTRKALIYDDKKLISMGFELSPVKEVGCHAICVNCMTK